MKNSVPIFLSSIASAFLAVMIYRLVEKPERIYVKSDPGSVVYTNFDDNGPSIDGALRTFLSSSPTDFISAAERVTPTVVNIRSVETTSRSWWGGSNAYGASSGSGVIISSDGYIVTNNHVVMEGKNFEVTLNDMREFEAKLIASDPFTDLALLKIEAEQLPYLTFGNSDSLRVGEWVMAVGNPFNLASTVTAGIVSAKGRSIDILEGDYSIESFIQTDAAVNPGNSGGALVNTNGELVGINTAIITRSGRYEGYSFAIPSNLALKVIQDLRNFGEVQRGLLGIKIGPVTGKIAKVSGLTSVEGVHINGVTPGGGAEEAGLATGDVIVGINNLKIKSIPELQEQIGRLHPGSSIMIEFIRDGNHRRVAVILKDKNQSTKYVVRNSENSLLLNLGFQIRELEIDQRRRLKVPGVYVESIEKGSTIAMTEMDPGYIITHIDGITVTSVQDIIDELKKKKGQEVYLEGFYENYPGEYYYTFKVR